MTNTFLFSWEESYSLTQELKKWKQAFLEKYGQEGIFEFAWDSMDLSVIQNAVMWWWMFVQKKLILIHWVPKKNDPTYKIPAWTQTAIETWLMWVWEQIPADHVVVLVCHKPDKRTKWWKYFEKNTTVKSFTPLKEKGATTLIQKQLWTLITASNAAHMVTLTGTSVRTIMHETEKLRLYASYHSISSLTKEHIDMVVFHQGEANAFGVLDTLLTDKTQCLTLLSELQQQQQDIFQTTWMLYWGLKIIIQMTDCLKKWITSSKEIASTIKAPPFAVAKQMKFADLYKEKSDQINTLFKEIVSIDRDIKTGKLPVEWFRVSLKTLVYAL